MSCITKPAKGITSQVRQTLSENILPPCQLHGFDGTGKLNSSCGICRKFKDPFTNLERHREVSSTSVDAASSFLAHFHAASILNVSKECKEEEKQK